MVSGDIIKYAKEKYYNSTSQYCTLSHNILVWKRKLVLSRVLLDSWVQDTHFSLCLKCRITNWMLMRTLICVNKSTNGVSFAWPESIGLFDGFCFMRNAIDDKVTPVTWAWHCLFVSSVLSGARNGDRHRSTPFKTSFSIRMPIGMMAQGSSWQHQQGTSVLREVCFPL